jgi:hemerythrin superfamily protein
MATRTRNQSNGRSGTLGRSGGGSTNRPGGAATQSSQSGSSSSRSNSRGSERSAFSWGEGAGPLIGAALAGAAFGIAANFGRKFVTQAVSGIAGDWDEVLATEHDMTLAVFDKMLATDENQTFKRTMLVKQLTHALDKHAHQEEMVVYPALREAGQRVEADQLNGEHGYVKTYLYDLNRMPADDPNWIETVREFRALIAEHVAMEEEQVFPALKEGLDEATNARITSLMNRDGFWQA